MNNLVPFSRPTFYTPGQNALSIGANLPSKNIVQTPSGPRFYTPKNLEGGNYLTNLTSKPAIKTGPEELRAIYNRDLGGGNSQATGGTDGTNQGAGVAQNPGDMSMEGLMSENESLGAFGDAVSVGGGLGFSFDPVGLIASLYAGGKSKLNKDEIEQRNLQVTKNGTLGAHETPSVAPFSFDPGMTEQEIADQNKNLQRSVSGTEQGISRNDPNPAPTGNTGDGQGGKIICNELYRQGYMPRHIWEADERFGATLDKATLEGYHAWAGPWVRVMQRSPLATRLTWLVARPWAQHMAFKMGAVEKDSLIGRQVMKFGLPLCRALYRREGSLFRSLPNERPHKAGRP